MRCPGGLVGLEESGGAFLDDLAHRFAAAASSLPGPSLDPPLTIGALSR
jgi:hypothetical protein